MIVEVEVEVSSRVSGKEPSRLSLETSEGGEMMEEEEEEDDEDE